MQDMPLRSYHAELQFPDVNHLCSLPSQVKRKSMKSKPSWSQRMREYITVSDTPEAIFNLRNRTSLQKERRRQEACNWCVIHPYSRFRLHWEMFMLAEIIISFIIVPVAPILHRTIQANPPLIVVYIFTAILCVVNAVDMILWFRTGVNVCRSKPVILELQPIARHYLCSVHFWADLISVIPFHLISLSVDDKMMLLVISCLPLVRLVRLTTVKMYFNRFIISNNMNRTMCSLLYYLIGFLMVLHWVTCFNCIILLYFGDGDSQFLPVEVPQTFTYTTRLKTYVFCLYRTASFMMRIAQDHGMHLNADAKMSKPLDIALALFSMAIGYGVLTYIFVITLKLLSAMWSTEIKYQSIFNQLSNYMSHKQLPLTIQNRVELYYEYRYEKTYFRETLLMSLLPTTLCAEINSHLYGTLIDKIAILNQIPEHRITEILSTLTPEIFLPNDVIIKASSVGDCMYFILRGTVMITTENGREIAHLRDGDYFGEVALMAPDQKRIANVVAVEACNLMRLDRKGLLRCFAEYPQLYQEIEMMAERRIRKCTLLEELHKKLLIERSLRKTLEQEDQELEAEKEAEEKLWAK